MGKALCNACFGMSLHVGKFWKRKVGGEWQWLFICSCGYRCSGDEETVKLLATGHDLEDDRGEGNANEGGGGTAK